MVARGGGVKKVKRLRSTNWWLQNSCGDIRYSIENIINGIVILCMRPDGDCRYQEDHFVKYRVV